MKASESFVMAADSMVSRAQVAKHQAENVPSPCISVCTMSATTGWCDGCFRTLDEIAAWACLSDGGKRIIWSRIEQRVKAVRP